MTKEQVDAIIALGPLVVAAVTSAVPVTFAVIKFFDFQKTRVIERSVGATKILELQQTISKLASQFEALVEKFRSQETQIKELHDDNKKMIKRIIDWSQK